MQLKKEKWLEIIIESIGDAIIVTDAKSCIKFLNLVAEAIKGWKQEDTLNRNLQEVFNIVNAETRIAVVSSAIEVLNKGISVCLSEQINLVSKNGIELLIADSAAPIKNRDGDITSAVVVFRSSDRTDIKGSKQTDYNFILLQAQLEIQKAELQR